MPAEDYTARRMDSRALAQRTEEFPSASAKSGVKKLKMINVATTSPYIRW